MTLNLGSRLLALLIVTLGLASCKRASVAVYDVPKEATSAPVVAEAAPAAPPTASTEKGWIQWSKPDAWTELPPTAFRKGNYVATGENGAKAEITVSSFPGTVGGTLANVNRWRGQAGLEPISGSELAAYLTEVNIDGHSGQIVDIPPTDNASDATHIVAAIFFYQGESWFFKFSGPHSIVARERANFDAFINGLRFTDTSVRNQNALNAESSVERTLAWDVPDGWTESSGSSLRLASYQVELEGFEPADFSITRFPGDAGGLAANVNRWRQQIGLRPWREQQIDDQMKTIQAGELEFMIFDLNPRTDAEKENVKERILAAIMKHEDHSYFYKLRGDVFLIETQRSNFRQIVQSSRFESQGDAQY